MTKSTFNHNFLGNEQQYTIPEIMQGVHVLGLYAQIPAAPLRFFIGILFKTILDFNPYKAPVLPIVGAIGLGGGNSRQSVHQNSKLLSRVIIDDQPLFSTFRINTNTREYRVNITILGYYGRLSMSNGCCTEHKPHANIVAEMDLYPEHIYLKNLKKYQSENIGARPKEPHPNPTYWRDLRDGIKKKKNRCHICGNSFGFCQLHHRHYDTWGCETEKDVVLVCPQCHANLHSEANHG